MRSFIIDQISAYMIHAAMRLNKRALLALSGLLNKVSYRLDGLRSGRNPGGDGEGSGSEKK